MANKLETVEQSSLARWFFLQATCRFLHEWMGSWPYSRVQRSEVAGERVDLPDISLNGDAPNKSIRQHELEWRRVKAEQRRVPF